MMPSSNPQENTAAPKPPSSVAKTNSPAPSYYTNEAKQPILSPTDHSESLMPSLLEEKVEPPASQQTVPPMLPAPSPRARDIDLILIETFADGIPLDEDRTQILKRYAEKLKKQLEETSKSGTNETDLSMPLPHANELPPPSVAADDAPPKELSSTDQAENKTPSASAGPSLTERAENKTPPAESSSTNQAEPLADSPCGHHIASESAPSANEEYSLASPSSTEKVTLPSVTEKKKAADELHKPSVKRAKPVQFAPRGYYESDEYKRSQAKREEAKRLEEEKKKKKRGKKTRRAIRQEHLAAEASMREEEERRKAQLAQEEERKKREEEEESRRNPSSFPPPEPGRLRCRLCGASYERERSTIRNCPANKRHNGAFFPNTTTTNHKDGIFEKVEERWTCCGDTRQQQGKSGCRPGPHRPQVYITQPAATQSSSNEFRSDWPVTSWR
ncbi:hypothetical protein GGR53DRAFT_91391 [Hypoxylon sp. FL1150]|nr:hypothetical protein GGR53DRAFT_91391 [Hypoxylon sp. FL1150]